MTYLYSLVSSFGSSSLTLVSSSEFFKYLHLVLMLIEFLLPVKVGIMQYWYWVELEMVLTKMDSIPAGVGNTRRMSG